MAKRKPSARTKKRGRRTEDRVAKTAARKKSATSKRKTARGGRAAQRATLPAGFLIPPDSRSLRETLLELDEPTRAALEARLGAAAVKRVVRSARRARAGARIGKVVVLHGIMGSNLDSCRDDDWDRVWVHAWRLAKGRIQDLELSENGAPIPGRPPVRVTGMFPEYLPLVVELQNRWEVLPFAYDWRADIDSSVERLAEALRTFAAGQPVHIVAHSMGGLVARRLAHQHPELWRAIDDPPKRERGGRLIQLGTPNRGSFAISLVLTAEEPIVRKLALIDVRHSKRELVELLRGFPGSYQMLPAPDALGDDRARLFDAGTWGSWPAVPALLERGRAFQEEMREVQDPERLVYVAGYDQETPDRVRVEKPGVFSYRVTREGDGRVPHDLGVLTGVRTFYVREVHGALPKNDQVLAGIHELLQHGTTGELDSAPRVRVRGPEPAAPVWKSAEEVLADESGFGDLPPTARSVAKRENQERIAAILLRGVVGDGPPEQEARPASLERPRREPPRVKVAVVHADVTRVSADLYAVGHYAGVLPQNAEWSFDQVVSGRALRYGEGVLASETRTGLLSGELGTVQIYPWHGQPNRLVAVAGMGAPGAFNPAALRSLGQSLTFRALHLPGVERMVLVLIGSGEGNLRPAEALRALFSGAADALEQHRGRAGIRELLIVDREERKANEIQAALKALAADREFARHLSLEAAPAVRKGPGRRSAREALEAEIARLKEAARKPIARDGQPFQGPISRVAWLRNERGMRVAALTSTVVVPERTIPIDLTLLDELVERMTDPDYEQAAEDAWVLGRLVVPQDFREHLAGANRLVVEVDRYMAGVHWEMLALGDPGDGARPLSLDVPLARQLRTEYAPAPGVETEEDRPLRVLIVGDPGDPETGWSLDGARDEALAVHELMHSLAGQGVPLEVVTLIGDPKAKRRGKLARFAPAGRLDVLGHLMRERWDILHYCGHGDFDPRNPSRVGWVFGNGKFLTADELRRVIRAPRLVVANACLSARTSDRLQRGKRSSEIQSEADLLPSLADEFFRRGVRNYVGTAWEVDDAGAVEFTECFYRTLFDAGETIGTALRAARRTLYAKQTRYDALWAAYQHYGNPDEQVARHGAT